MPRPLEHIRVLDLSRSLAGPWAAQILADLGADVIKVERAGAGDETRTWGPPFLKDKNGAETQESGYFLTANRGKRSITVNMDSEEGQTIIRDLAAESDVLIENFKVGTLARRGLGYDDLKKINPSLIYCSITGFGQDGPRSKEPAYDFLIQAMGGLMSVTGERDDLPGGGPQKVGVPIIDMVTGTYAALAVIAGVAGRTETGKGDYIDVAMLDVSVNLLSNQAMNFLVGKRTPKRTGNGHPNIQPQQVFACREDSMVLVVGNDGQYAKMCVALGRPELAEDSRYAKNRSRLQHEPELTQLLKDIFKEQDAAYWVRLLSDAGVPCGRINSVDQVFDDPQVRHRELVRHVPHPTAGTAPQIIQPFRFREMALEFNSPPPMLGQHTAEVLAELGRSPQEIAELYEKGVS